MLKFELDIPPTSNHRLAPVMTKSGTAMVKTPIYRTWMTQAVRTLTEGQPKDWQPIDEPVGIFVEICFPDRRRRDLDNVLKPLNDVITKAGIWQDDSLIVFQTVTRGKVLKPGLIRAIIFPLKTLKNACLATRVAVSFEDFEELMRDADKKGCSGA